MSYCEWYRDQFAKTLSEPLSESDGIPLDDVASLLGDRIIPDSLRDYYLVAGRHWMNTHYDRLLQPNELRTADSYTIFMNENQCVSYWAFKNTECSLDDPAVYQGQFENETLVWYSLDQRLSRFIVDSWLESCTGGDDEFATQ